ncbi:unnamed protein product [Closterium sp. NIES-64]|nr:unnamed protein product [Closterium sp. NIES-64]
MRPHRRLRESLTPQQLREWYAGWGCRGGGATTATTPPAASTTGGGQMQLPRPPRASLTPQQLRECADRAGHLCVPPDPGIGPAALASGEAAAALGASESPAPGTGAAAALGASESASSGAGEAALSGTTLASASLTFTLDSGASRSFFRDRTTLTPLGRPVAVSLADPSGVLSSLTFPLSSRVRLPPRAPCLASTSPRSRRTWTFLCPCVEGRLRAAPHSSQFPPTEAPLQTLHMDVWGPAPVRGQGHERYFLLVVDDYSRYTTVFPLRSKGAVIEGIRQTFTLPDSPQQNGIAERRIGMVMDVARTSMMHAAAPHFLWPFAVRYAAHQLNLHPRVSRPDMSPVLLWTGKVGDASAFRVWGSRAFVRDLSADKLSPRAAPCVFLGFPPNAPGWQFYHPSSRRVLSSQDVTFDESVPFYRLFPYRTPSLPPPPTSWCQFPPGRPPPPSGSCPFTCVPAWGAALLGVLSLGVRGRGVLSLGVLLLGVLSREVLRQELLSLGVLSLEVRSLRVLDLGALRLLRLGGSRSLHRSCASGLLAAGGVLLELELLRLLRVLVLPVPELLGLRVLLELELLSLGVLTAEPGFSPGAASRREPLSPQEMRGWFARRWRRTAGAGASSTVEGTGAAGPGGATPAGPTGAGAAEGVGAESAAVCPDGGSAAGATGGPAAGGVGGAGAAAEGAGAVPAESGAAARLGQSDSLRAASPTVTRLLATVVTDPSFESAAASALVAELVDFAARCRLDYAASLVAESASVCPPSVGGECALGTDVLEDRQEEFQCLAAASPHLASVLLAPEGDPDALDIPTPRSYAEAVEGPYSSQWQAAMDAEMASWKSTGTYVDAVPPPGANIVSGMWIFRVKGRRALHLSSRRGSLHEEIWLRRPPGFTGTFPPGTQWSLRRPVYGLRQAPREWHDTLRTTLAALGFAPSTADPSLFLRTDTSLPPFYILVYVDDLVFATADTAGLAYMKSELLKRHTCTDLGELRSYLGLQITRTEHAAPLP